MQDEFTIEGVEYGSAGGIFSAGVCGRGKCCSTVFGAETPASRRKLDRRAGSLPNLPSLPSSMLVASRRPPLHSILPLLRLTIPNGLCVEFRHTVIGVLRAVVTRDNA